MKLDVTASGTSMVAPATISHQPCHSWLNPRCLKQKQFLDLTKLSKPKSYDEQITDLHVTLQHG